MKKDFYILFVLFFLGGFTIFSQIKKVDTVKTEVIQVDTKYNPKIADANKVKIKPEIKLGDKNKKKKLTYKIASIPVASSFAPKSGVIKTYSPDQSERSYNNFFAAGFGNFTTHYLEAFIKHNFKYSGEFGLSTNYNASLDNIENTILDSDFSDFNANVYYKKEERAFNWKVDLTTELSRYNWYGISPNMLNQNTVDTIDEVQTYSFYRIGGNFDFEQGAIRSSRFGLSSFSDDLDSNELIIDFDTDLAFNLGLRNRNAKNLILNVGLEFLNGSFDRNYNSGNALEYSIFTARLNPFFSDKFGPVSIRAGAKVFASMDLENDVNNVLIYPDLRLETSLIEEKLQMFLGADGGLSTNTFRSFVNVNPFVAPSLAITQTSQTYNAFAGLKGLINNSLSFNLSSHLIQEEDKPLFIRNNSKFNGTNGATLLGYEFGNSFQVIYDDVKTLRIIADVNYDINQNLTIGANAQFDSFTMTNQTQAWNLPELQACFYGRYSAKKWYAATQLFYVGDRNDVIYTTIHPTPPSNTSAIVDGFLDLNVNGGYHFNDRFSVFLRANNILNSDYQIFNNFTVQGFQILAGLTYKFDF